MANVPTGNSPMARRRRDMLSQVHHTGHTVNEILATRVGMYSVAGFPNSVEDMRLTKKSMSLGSLPQRREEDLEPKKSKHRKKKEYPQLPPPAEDESFPYQPVYYHPLGMSDPRIFWTQTQWKHRPPGEPEHVNRKFDEELQRAHADRFSDDTGASGALMTKVQRRQKDAQLWTNTALAFRQMKSRCQSAPSLPDRDVLQNSCLKCATPLSTCNLRKTVQAGCTL
eukprot:TRINITY_DN25329_c0_g2_i1.p1 TRINITY_DN25329_c0_g2~~TRINITY_DN25329_c0_g2_i1.p1  ORF type:complete len:225 (-),score=43.27 TRINITY_DN25329_c0_g2_i1:147-821(-)